MRSEPGKTRAERLDASCPSCACEHGAVGAFGSPGRVANDERLYRVIVAPPDMSENQLVLTSLTQAEQKGLSVLRGSASDEEFIHVARKRLKDQSERRVHGVAEFLCSEVRELFSEVTEGRSRVQRLFCIYDTDEEKLPCHADIFQTSPTGLSKNKTRSLMKEDREKLLRVVAARLISADAFRGGILARL